MNDNLKRTLVEAALKHYLPRLEQAKPDSVLPCALWVITGEMRMFFFEVVMPPERDFLLAVLRRVVQEIGATHAAIVADSFVTVARVLEGEPSAVSEKMDAIHVGGAVRETGQTFGVTLPYKRVDGKIAYEDRTEDGVDTSDSFFTGRMTRWFVPPDVTHWPQAAKDLLDQKVRETIDSLQPLLRPQRRH